MKTGVLKIMAFVLATSLTTFTATTTAQAREICRWVPAHMENGHWVHGKRVCWYQRGYHDRGYHHKRCRMVGGYWHHGVWHKPHRRCGW